MSECTNESLDYAILNENYKPSEEEIQQLAQNVWNYRKAYKIIMEYWHCLPDEVQVYVDKQLKEEAGL